MNSGEIWWIWWRWRSSFLHGLGGGENKRGRGSWSAWGEEGEGEGAGWGGGSVGPNRGAWRSFSAHTTRRQRHSRTVREGGSDRPSVPDRNISPFSKS
jgi:hypothetical protein